MPKLLWRTLICLLPIYLSACGLLSDFPSEEETEKPPVTEEQVKKTAQAKFFIHCYEKEIMNCCDYLIYKVIPDSDKWHVSFVDKNSGKQIMVEVMPSGKYARVL